MISEHWSLMWHLSHHTSIKYMRLQFQTHAIKSSKEKHRWRCQLHSFQMKSTVVNISGLTNASQAV